MTKRWRAGRLALLLGALALTGCATGDEAPDSPAAPRPSAAPANDGLAAVPDVVAEVQSSVVSIRTAGGEGSGVVYDDDGVIVTNAHVVGDAEQVEVLFADGQTVPGEVVATDRVVDLAVVQTARRDVPPVEIDVDLPRVGSLAIAMGNPLGFENTVTAGIVSGLHRQIPGSASQTPSLVDLIQTDAPISPGNSGGALLSADGNLIGINVAYIPPQARAVSIGFAIPSATVVETVDELLADGRAEHAWLGIVPAPVTPRLAEQFELETSAGVLVAQVEREGPSAGALQQGDIITGIGDRSIESVEDLLAALRRAQPGEALELRIVRDGRRVDRVVTLGARP